MTKLHKLYEKQGQSIWLDFISRDILEDGTLARLIAAGVRGLTSNPTIFEKAISGSSAYDGEIRRLMSAGADTFAVYDALSQADVAGAADLLRPVYDASDGADGLASIEVSPELAYDTAGTLTEARRIWGALARPNIMIKVPATDEGVVAIRQLISEGINVNATLMFSLANYDAVAHAYLEGVEQRVALGGTPHRIASVASFFVSRIDTVVDQQLAAAGAPALQGQIANANARLAYHRFQQVFRGERWERLAQLGARVQRPLWASTSTKNPAYPELLYVDNLIGPDTVNTLPLPTAEAALARIVVKRTLDKGIRTAQNQMRSLSGMGIDFDRITADLQSAGVRSFADSFRNLLAAIESRMRLLGGS